MKYPCLDGQEREFVPGRTVQWREVPQGAVVLYRPLKDELFMRLTQPNDRDGMWLTTHPQHPCNLGVSSGLSYTLEDGV